jgi:hypothetical protein
LKKKRFDRGGAMHALTYLAGRTPAALFVFAIAVSSPTFAQMALVTVDPNNFVAGQNISNATPGARLLSLSAVSNGNPTNPSTVPQYSPVYAQPVAAGCTLAPGIPCALDGTLALGYSSTTVPSTQLILWGEENDAADTCIPPPGLGCDTDGPPVLRINFTVPTDYASAAIGFFPADASGIRGFEAFDASGQSIAMCEGLPGFQVIPAGCATVIVSYAPFDSGWAYFTVSSPTANISYVLVGGVANWRPIANVQFDSPVPLQLVGLVAKARGVGPGGSLELKALTAGVYYAVHDTQAACASLKSFVTEVDALRGTHINKVTAAQLLAIALPIEAAIACQ